MLATPAVLGIGNGSLLTRGCWGNFRGPLTPSHRAAPSSCWFTLVALRSHGYIFGQYGDTPTLTVTHTQLAGIPVSMSFFGSLRRHATMRLCRNRVPFNYFLGTGQNNTKTCVRFLRYSRERPFTRTKEIGSSTPRHKQGGGDAIHGPTVRQVGCNKTEATDAENGTSKHSLPFRINYSLDVA